MVFNFRQGLPSKVLKIGIRTVRNLILIEGCIGVLIFGLAYHVVSITRLATLMLKRRNHRGIGGFQERRRRYRRLLLKNRI